MNVAGAAKQMHFTGYLIQAMMMIVCMWMGNDRDTHGFAQDSNVYRIIHLADVLGCRDPDRETF